jgi:multiple sugar transport system permease protein
MTLQTTPTRSIRPEVAAPRRRWRLTEGRVGYLFLLPWFVGLFALTAGPILASLYLAFTDFDLLTTPAWVGLDNFERMFTDDQRYRNALRVTLLYVVV